MIIVKIHGGLGNQLFQYAAGRALAESLHMPLKLDNLFFMGSPNRKFILEKFNISPQFATQEEINSVKMRDYPFPVQKMISLFRKVKGANNLYIKEGSRSLDVDKLGGYDQIYLKGYWQNEKYFQHIEPVIRSEFTLTSKPDPINQQYLADILFSNSVSVHIRRGDYISDPIVNKKFVVCNLDYYYKAIDLISERVTNPQFYIFSDDTEWVSENFHIKHPTVLISHNKNQEHEDLRLMSFCKHHIIANSSFSWWGAWLCDHKEKIVLAPAKWYKNLTLTKSNKDFIPQSWQKIA